MNHKRALPAVLAVTLVFFLALIIWIKFIAPHAPEGTLPYQMVIVVFGYGFILGLALLWSQRPSRADRKLYKRGHEGWAVITSVNAVDGPAVIGELTELGLRLTVPGTGTYEGRLVRPLDRYEKRVLVPGATIPIRVDPRNRDHIMLCP